MEGPGGEFAVQNFRWIESGAFLMGSPVDEPERSGIEGRSTK